MAVNWWQVTESTPQRLLSRETRYGVSVCVPAGRMCVFLLFFLPERKCTDQHDMLPIALLIILHSPNCPNIILEMTKIIHGQKYVM